MNLKQDLHLGYVLHARAYRETSLLLELLSAEHGHISAVARGAKRGKAKSSSVLQPFTPLQISWYGNGDLVTLTVVEAMQVVALPQGRSAICGLYMNELLIKLLPKWDPCAELFCEYASAVANLAAGKEQEQVILRRFEVQLLKSLGYGLQLNQELELALATGEFKDKRSWLDLRSKLRIALGDQLGNRKIVSRELL